MADLPTHPLDKGKEKATQDGETAERQEYQTFVSSLLSPTTNPTFLLIGENHQSQATALRGLANTIDDILNSEKNVILFTENLPQLTSTDGQPKQYTIQDFKNSFPEWDKPELDKDYYATLALITAGVKIYGVENQNTDPSKLLDNNATKEQLYMEATKKFPEIFTKENKSDIIADMNDNDITADDFRDTLKTNFVNTNERIIKFNNEVTNLMSESAKSNPGNTLVVFAGGAAHLPQAHSSKTGDEIHPGIIKMMQNNADEIAVNACFFNHVNDGKNTYTPKADNILSYGTIPNKLTTPSQYSQKDYQTVLEATKKSPSKYQDKKIPPINEDLRTLQSESFNKYDKRHAASAAKVNIANQREKMHEAENRRDYIKSKINGLTTSVGDKLKTILKSKNEKAAQDIFKQSESSDQVKRPRNR